MIVIIGVGALGSHLAQSVRNVKVPIRLIDFDRVEIRNTTSQWHGKMFVGQNKAKALQQALQGMFGLKVDASPYRLTADNADALLRGATLIVDCTDNKATRDLIQVYARAQNIQCVHGALAAAGQQFARVIWTDRFKSDQEEPGATTCEDGEDLPFICSAAAVLAETVRHFLATGEQRSWQITPNGQMRVA